MNLEQAIEKRVEGIARWSSTGGLKDLVASEMLEAVKEDREHGQFILEVAEAAHSDALLYKLFIEKVETSPEMFSKILQDFRELREKHK